MQQRAVFWLFLLLAAVLLAKWLFHSRRRAHIHQTMQKLALILLAFSVLFLLYRSFT